MVYSSDKLGVIGAAVGVGSGGAQLTVRRSVTKSRKAALVSWDS